MREARLMISVRAKSLGVALKIVIQKRHHLASATTLKLVVRFAQLASGCRADSISSLARARAFVYSHLVASDRVQRRPPVYSTTEASTTLLPWRRHSPDAGIYMSRASCSRGVKFREGKNMPKGHRRASKLRAAVPRNLRRRKAACFSAFFV